MVKIKTVHADVIMHEIVKPPQHAARSGSFFEGMKCFGVNAVS